MEILNLSLTNFKGHEDEFFQFSRGTNAICGENGAGKTSIFEAIAWVLFDHCDYQKKELIRTGAGSASATVEFLSSLDGRCYRIKRNTQRGYDLFDPQLDAKLNVKKREDVQQWLREHLGVPRNTELSRLFAETIGIPQGTFTADFLKRPGDRKNIFDPILKVEDYKQTYNNTRDLETYAKAQVSELEQNIELAMVQLADWDTLKDEGKVLGAEIATDQAQIAALNERLTQDQQSLSAMEAIATEIESLTQQQQALAQEKVRQNAEQAQAQQSLKTAQDAAQICQQHQGGYQQYLQTQQTLKTLQEQRQRYQNVVAQQNQLTQTINQLEVQQSSLSTQLEGFAQVEAQIQALHPLIPQQEQWEKQQLALQQHLQTSRVQEGKIQSLSQQIQQLNAERQTLEAEINASSGSQERLAELPRLEQERQDVMKAMGHWEISQDWLGKLQPIFTEGKLDRDRHRSAVQAALKLLEGYPNELETVESALKEGAILNTGLLKSMHQLLTELNEAASPERLNQKLQDLAIKIQSLQQLKTESAMVQVKQQQQQTCDRRLHELQPQLAQAQATVQELPMLLKQLKSIETELSGLGNPKSQFQLLQRQLQNRGELQQKFQQQSNQISQMIRQQNYLTEELTQFQSLDQNIHQAQTDLDQNQASYQLYLQHQNSAAQVTPLTDHLETLEHQLSQLRLKQTDLDQKKSELEQNFNRESFQQLQLQLQSTQVQLGQLQGGLVPKEQRFTQIETQLAHKQELFDQSERDRTQLSEKQNIFDFIQEARRIYNQSGPRISELYQQEISFEADRLFRELLHRQDVALAWTEDYDIRVQENGHWRTFKSLSGGEQMCAALAVRLALLKTFADINVAFFDEPTTNMDGLRRSQLAEAISNLKSFNQLFVISHDDTFEAITESIIRLKPKKLTS